MKFFRVTMFSVDEDLRVNEIKLPSSENIVCSSYSLWCDVYTDTEEKAINIFLEKLQRRYG